MSGRVLAQVDAAVQAAEQLADELTRWDISHNRDTAAKVVSWADVSITLLSLVRDSLETEIRVYDRIHTARP